MRHRLHLSVALASIAVIAAACSGGGGAGPSSALPPGNSPGHGYTPSSVTFAIAIPGAGTTAAAHKPGYISPGTQSIGVVVTNQGASPSPAQYTNVSTCPQVSGVTTCSVTVSALPGSDSFAISAYGGQNGGGSVLSTGSITSTVVEGTANTTQAVTLGGVIASISITPGIAALPLGQSTVLNVAAKDASGATIVGTFDHAIAISAPNMVLSTSSVTNSTDASKIVAAWSLGFSSSTASTVTASGDGVNGTVAITPASGFAYYQTGTNPVTDTVGFKMIAGPDGNLYYTTLGPVACPTGQVCVVNGGAVHQFNPTTKTDTEIALRGQGVGMTFTSDGALWIGGGVKAPDGNNYLYRMAPGSFSSAALTPIPVPTTSARNTRIGIREGAQDGSGNLWFVDAGATRYMKIPVAGPYASSSISFYRFPRGIAGTPGYYGAARKIHYAGGVIVADDFQNGEEVVIDPSTGNVTGQYLTNLQTSFGANGAYDSANTYDATDNGTTVYIAQIGDSNATVPAGDLEAFNPATHAFTTMPYVPGLVAQQPTVPSIKGNLIYVADFYRSSVDVLNLTNGTARAYPQIQAGESYFRNAGAMAAMSDGTAWFPCYASAQVFQPLCVGHTVYLSGWSIWPSSSITLFGAGPANAQLVGIMEPPVQTSGPFTVTSSNTSVCSIASASDHNFNIVGQSAGACTVTVKDKNNVSQTINVTVTTITGTVQAKVKGGV